jgi:hypothetical protein
MSFQSFSPADLTKRDLFANPYPLYQALRAQSPVHYIGLPANESSGIKEPIWSWGLLKYDVVASLDGETFSNRTIRKLDGLDPSSC